MPERGLLFVVSVWLCRASCRQQFNSSHAFFVPLYRAALGLCCHPGPLMANEKEDTVNQVDIQEDYILENYGEAVFKRLLKDHTTSRTRKKDDGEDN